MAENEEISTIVLDNGSGQLKAGIAGEDAPSSVFPAIVGVPKHQTVMQGVENKEFYVGHEAQRKRGALALKYPIEHGIIGDWVDMERIWSHAFSNELRRRPEDHFVLLTDAPMNPKSNREQIVTTMFECFQVQGMYISIQALLALYASGRTTGLVVDSGDGVTHVVPIYEGFSMPTAINRLNLAGRDLTQLMQQLLMVDGYNLTTSAEFETVRDIKEALCYVADDFESECQRIEDPEGFEYVNRTYDLPDGKTIEVCKPRFECPELLFNPSASNKEMAGIHKTTYDSIEKCDLDSRTVLSSNIVMSGGTTMIPNIGKRLENEMIVLSPANRPVKVITPPERKYTVWIGGSILGSLTAFKSMCITRADYDEKGASIIHTKCF